MARIVVTVGMGRWPFDRLVTAAGRLAADHDVFVQTGTSSVRLPCPSAHLVDRLPARDGDEPRLDVDVVREVGPRAQRGEEGLGPGVLGVAGTEHGAAHPQHGRPVLLHHPLERRPHAHSVQTHGPGRT